MQPLAVPPPPTVTAHFLPQAADKPGPTRHFNLLFSEWGDSGLRMYHVCPSLFFAHLA